MRKNYKRRPPALGKERAVQYRSSREGWQSRPREGLVAQGRIPAESKETFAGVLVFLPDAPAVAFAAGGRKKERSPRQALRETLNAMPEMVAFGEVTRFTAQILPCP